MDNTVYFRSIPIIGKEVFEICVFIFLQKSFLETNNSGIKIEGKQIKFLSVGLQTMNVPL